MLLLGVGSLDWKSKRVQLMLFPIGGKEGGLFFFVVVSGFFF